MLLRLSIACCLFLLVIYGHASSKVIVATDSMWSIYLAQSFVTEGDLLLDEYRPLAKKRKNYGLRKRKGHLYSYFPVGTALLAVPFVWAYNHTFFHQTLPIVPEMLPGFPTDKSLEERSPENLNLPLQRLIASIFVALTIVVLFFISTQFLPLGASVVVALIAAFCTPLWSTASRGLWQHGPSALLISTAILMILNAKTKPILAGFSGALLAYAYIVRPTNAIAFLCFGFFLLFTSRESFRIFVLTALLIFVPFVSFSYNFFGLLLPPYYNAGRLQLGWHLPQALFANLFSANRGIFFLSPVLIPAILGMYKVFREIRVDSIIKPSLPMAVVAAFFGHLLAISLFPEWWGGHAFGARYMTETVPYLIYFCVLWLRDSKLNNLKYGLLFISACLSFFIHYKGATSYRTFMWNVNPVNIDRRPERVWDLGDLQFLR